MTLQLLAEISTIVTTIFCVIFSAFFLYCDIFLKQKVSGILLLSFWFAIFGLLNIYMFSLI